MKNNFKIMFFSLLIFSTMISISASSWLGMWLGLEMNLLSIMPILYTKNNLISSEASIKYFITQTIASSMIMINIILILLNFNISSNLFLEMNLMMMNSAFLVKIGMAPFHFWFPEIINGLSWLNSLIIFTWQKIAPMVILMFNQINSKMMLFFIISSLIISSLSSLNQINIKKILTFSSINHMSWMMSMMMLSKIIWMIYFITYVLTTVIMVLFLNKFKIIFLKQLSNFNNKKEMTLFFFLAMFSFMGLPPTINFISKWLTIQTLISMNFNLLSMLLITFTILMIYIYFQLMVNSLLFNSENTNFLMNKKSNLSLMSFMNFFNLTGLIMMTFIFN